MKNLLKLCSFVLLSLLLVTGTGFAIWGTMCRTVNADAGGPYYGLVGEEITLDGSSSSGATFYGWDLNNDGSYWDSRDKVTTNAWDSVGEHTVSIEADGQECDCYPYGHPKYPYENCNDVTDYDYTSVTVTPYIETFESTDIDTLSASLEGKTNFTGLTGSNVYFEWREKGKDTWNSTDSKYLDSSQEFEESIENLDIDTEYEVRAVVSWSSGGGIDSGTNYGEIREFKTKRLVETFEPESVGTYSATLKGNLNLGDIGESEVYFQWREQGEETWIETDKKFLTEEGEFDESLDNLEADTLYEFRTVAEWDDGEEVENGEINQFVTGEDYELDLDIDGKGTVEINGEEVNDSYSGVYPEYTEINLHAYTDYDGWVFDIWLGDVSEAEEENEEINITMSQDKSITADFFLDFEEGDGTEENPYKIENWYHLDNLREYGVGEGRYYEENTHFALANDLDKSVEGYNDLVGENRPVDYSEDEYIGDSRDKEFKTLFSPIKEGALTINIEDYGEPNEDDYEVNYQEGTIIFDEPPSDLYGVSNWDDVTVDYELSETQYKGWEPIGEQDWSDEVEFEGILDGQNHEIRRLFINRFNGDYYGLFGYIENEGEIKNLGLKDLSINLVDSSNVGGLAGYTEGETHNSYVENGSISINLGGGYIGGLMGESYGDIINSHAEADISAPPGTWNVGGLVGYIRDSDIHDSHASGHIEVPDSPWGIGGLVGYIYDGEINNSSSTGSIEGDTLGDVGGLIGFSYYVDIIDSHSEVDVYGENYEYGIGGLVGGHYDGDIYDSHSTGSVITGNESWGIGGLTGYFDGAEIKNSISTGDVETGEGSSSVGGLSGYTNGKVINSTATGSVTGDWYVGGLIGENDGGSVSDSYASGEVTGESNVGGLIGYNYGDLSQSYATGQVKGEDFIGGLTGEHYDYEYGIEKSYATGNVKGANYTGGLIGRNGGTVNSSYSQSKVQGKKHTGGLTGRNGYNEDWSGKIINSYSTGNITGEKYTGGLIGSQNNTYSEAQNSYWDTETSGQDESDGGIGKTTAEMQNFKIYGFGGWDIDFNTDEDYEDYNDGYPFLSWEYEENSPTWYIYEDEENIEDYTLSIDKEGEGEIKVNGEEIDVPHEEELIALTSVYIEAIPDEAWRFTGWEGNIPEEMKEQKLIQVTIVEDTSISANFFEEFAGGEGSEDNPYQIENWYHLDNVRNYLDSHFKVIENLDRYTDGYDELVKNTNTQELANDGKGWEPLSNDTDDFTGSFDGGNHTIEDLHINRPEDNVSLFGYSEGAVFENIGMENVNITGQIAASLVNMGVGGEISNSYAQGKINGTMGDTGETGAGGLIAIIAEGIIKNSYFEGEVTGSEIAGGLVGASQDSSIQDSNFNGSTIQIAEEPAERMVAGGLIGISEGSYVSNSYVEGSVHGEVMVGGLVGNLDHQSTVFDSYAEGNISGEMIVGGLVGMSQGGEIKNTKFNGEVLSEGERPHTMIGGLVGSDVVAPHTVKNSQSSGEVTLNTTNLGHQGAIGGLVGHGSHVIESSSNSTVKIIGELESSDIGPRTIGPGGVEVTVGGLVGYLEQSFGGPVSTLKNSYSEGEIIENLEIMGEEGEALSIGGLVGYNDNDLIINSYSTTSINKNIQNENIVVGSLVGFEEQYSDTVDSIALESDFPLIGMEQGSQSGRVTEAPEEDMKTVELYNNNDFKEYENLSEPWDIATVGEWDGETWHIEEDEDYPRLGFPFEISYEIEDWYDLDRVRYDLEGDYTLINDIDEDTEGYEDVVFDESNYEGEWEAGKQYERDDIVSFILEDQKFYLKCIESHQQDDGDENPDIEYWEVGIGFEPIGKEDSRFRGSLDGAGNKIKDLYINRAEDQFTGLFGAIGKEDSQPLIEQPMTTSTEDSIPEIKNITLDRLNVTGGMIVGGLVGSISDGRISNSDVSGNVNQLVTMETSPSPYDMVVGGLVGSSEESLVLDSHMEGEVDGEMIVGGLIGRKSMSIGGPVLSSEKMNLMGTQYDEPGIYYSSSSGKVSGSIVGGITGEAGPFIGIMQSYSESDIKSSSNDFDIPASGGGLIGESENIYLLDSYSLSDVLIEDNDYDAALGGLIGRSNGNTHIRNTYAFGEVENATSSPPQRVAAESINNDLPHSSGSLIGYVLNSLTIENSYASEEITNQGNLTGFVDQYADVETPGSELKPTEQIKNISTYEDAGWDIENTTKEDPTGEGSPFLSWQTGNSPTWYIYEEPKDPVDPETIPGTTAAPGLNTIATLALFLAAITLYIYKDMY